MLRAALLALFAAAPLPPAAGKPPAITTSAIRWAGASGRTVHGYMALPTKARGRQPALLVLAETQAAGQALVDELARSGFIACTPRGDEPEADLAASLAWLRTNRYATGRVAIVALGPTGATRAAAVLKLAEASPVAALLISGASPTPELSAVPTLNLPPAPMDAGLQPQAAAFLKEHLR